jgi:hypothetical protein
MLQHGRHGYSDCPIANAHADGYAAANFHTNGYAAANFHANGHAAANLHANGHAKAQPYTHPNTDTCCSYRCSSRF